MITDKDWWFGIAHNGAGGGLQRLLSCPRHDPIDSPADAATPFQREVVAALKAMKGARRHGIGMTSGAVCVHEPGGKQTALDRRPGITVEIANHDHGQSTIWID